jgi:hypothetical protein
MHISIQVKSMDVYANKIEKVKQKHFFLKQNCIDLERGPINRQFVYKETEILVRGNRQETKTKLCRKSPVDFNSTTVIMSSSLSSSVVR